MNVKLEPEREATAAATGAVVAHVLSRPDSIRQRAQAAATISGALGVALVVGALTGLTQEGESFQWVTVGFLCAGIGGFAVSVWLSVYAVVFPHDVRRQKATGKADGPSTYQALIGGYETYADDVRQKMRWAAVATGIALSATTVGVVLEIIERTDAKSMRLVVSPEALSDLQSLCLDGDRLDGSIEPRVIGELREGELSEDVVHVDPWSLAVRADDEAGGTTEDPGPRNQLCNGSLELPSEWIRAVAHDGG